MLRTVIIDDEEAGVRTLKYLLEKYASDSVKVIDHAYSGEDGISIIELFKPDVVFLDISMPGTNGFQLLDKLTFKNFKLVFTTAHRDYAIQAIKNHAFDYILKPIDPDDLKACIDKLKTADKDTAKLRSLEAPLAVNVKTRIIYISPADIIRIEAAGSYSVIYCENDVKHTVSRVLKDFEPLLDTERFMRCHKSHIVNLRKVSKLLLKEGSVQMRDGSEVSISRAAKDEFTRRFKTI